MSFLEVIMLICFGSAWPFSIYKTISCKKVEGKSPIFLFVILLGYCAGILHKYFYSYDKVIYLYLFNAILVALDLLLFYRYRLKK